MSKIIQILLEYFNLYSFLVLNELGIFSIDTIILSFPDRLYETPNLTREIIMPIWSVIETKLENKTLTSAGVSDFNKNYLEQFCSYIENKAYLPSLNQVNLNTCCKMPEELLEFAKNNNIQLTTHSDSRGFQSNLQCLTLFIFFFL